MWKSQNVTYPLWLSSSLIKVTSVMLTFYKKQPGIWNCINLACCQEMASAAKFPAKLSQSYSSSFHVCTQGAKYQFFLFIWSSHILLFRQKMQLCLKLIPARVGYSFGQVNWVQINYFNDFINIISTLSGKKNFDRNKA